MEETKRTARRNRPQKVTRGRRTSNTITNKSGNKYAWIDISDGSPILVGQSYYQWIPKLHIPELRLVRTRNYPDESLLVLTAEELIERFEKL